MPPRFSVGHRDDNEPQITEVLRTYRVRYVLLDEGDGADILVFTAPMQLWEVKNPMRPPGKQKLTAAEELCKMYCDERRIPYRVIKYPEEAVDLLNQYRVMNLQG